MLGTIGATAPFVGLFGTVVGIIKAFSDLAVGSAKGAGAAVVMSGISEALVATAIGILVAIPAVVAFNVYNRWLKSIVGRTEAMSHAIVSHLENRAGSVPVETRVVASAPEATTPTFFLREATSTQR